jgi:hypothetical protein
MARASSSGEALCGTFGSGAGRDVSGVEGDVLADVGGEGKPSTSHATTRKAKTTPASRSVCGAAPLGRFVERAFLRRTQIPFGLFATMAAHAASINTAAV